VIIIRINRIFNLNHHFLYSDAETDELLVQNPALIANINIAPDIHSGHIVGVPINAITQKNSSMLLNGHPNILNEALSTSGKTIRQFENLLSIWAITIKID
jgi:hypothetical protein